MSSLRYVSRLSCWSAKASPEREAGLSEIGDRLEGRDAYGEQLYCKCWGRLRMSSRSRGWGKTALRLPKMSLRTNPLFSQLNRSRAVRDRGGNATGYAEIKNYGSGHEITAAHLNFPPAAFSRPWLQNTSALHLDVPQRVNPPAVYQKFRC